MKLSVFHQFEQNVFPMPENPVFLNLKRFTMYSLYKAYSMMHDIHDIASTIRLAQTCRRGGTRQ